jgi:hypothetical protein
MAILKKQQRKRARKSKARMRVKPRPGGAGSRVGDDLVEAAEQMATHLRGEIELRSYDIPSRSLPKGNYPLCRRNSAEP